MAESKVGKEHDGEEMDEDEKEEDKGEDKEEEKSEDVHESLQLEGMEMVDQDMEKKMKEVTSGLDVDSFEEGNLSILYFHSVIWDMYGPDIGNLISAVNAITL